MVNQLRRWKRCPRGQGDAVEDGLRRPAGLLVPRLVARAIESGLPLTGRERVLQALEGGIHHGGLIAAATHREGGGADRVGAQAGLAGGGGVGTAGVLEEVLDLGRVVAASLGDAGEGRAHRAILPTGAGRSMEEGPHRSPATPRT